MYSSFADILGNSGCVIISHRLASAKMADRIIVLHDGTIFESGKHEELINNSALYAQMWQAQSSWYLEEAGR
jgi:ABC-type multidrug transport system fused ATPase/permease subunit